MNHIPHGKTLFFNFITSHIAIIYGLDLWTLFSLKQFKAFRIAQCKQPRLGKSCLNSDLYFIFKILGTAFLEIIVSYKPLPSLSLGKHKNLSPRTSRYIENSLNVHLFFHFDLWLGKSKGFNNERIKLQIKRTFKNYFLSPKK